MVAKPTVGRCGVAAVAAITVALAGCEPEDHGADDVASEFLPDEGLDAALDATPDSEPDAPIVVPDVPGPDATCGELSDYLRRYSAVHRTCSMADECELAVRYWEHTFCYLPFDLPGLEDAWRPAALRTDAVSAEFEAARTRFDTECGLSSMSCTFDACGLVRVLCSGGRCAGDPWMTDCPGHDGSSGSG